MPNSEHRPTARVLNILQLLSTSKEGYSLTEIATAIQVPKSTITPIIHTLCDRHFITPYGHTGKYVVGINAFSVGSACLQNMDILSLIQVEMKKIVNQTKETCQLGTLIDGNVLYLAKEDSPEPIRLISFVGKRLPAYCTALGKSLLSDYSLAELKAIYKNGLQSITANTLTDFDQLYCELTNIKHVGFSSEHEEVSKDLICFAIPLQYSGKIIAAISISIPTFRITEEKEKIIKNCLKNVKIKLEKLFIDLNIDKDIFSYMPLQIIKNTN